MLLQLRQALDLQLELLQGLLEAFDSEAELVELLELLIAIGLVIQIRLVPGILLLQERLVLLVEGLLQFFEVCCCLLGVELRLL